MGEVNFRGAPLAAYHDQQLRFDYVPDASGAIGVTGSSKPAIDLLGSEHGEGARKLLLSIEGATARHSGRRSSRGGSTTRTSRRRKARRCSATSSRRRVSHTRRLLPRATA